MFQARLAHHQERQIVSIQPLVRVVLCWWPRCVQVERRLLLPTCTQLGHQHRMTVTSGWIDTICLSWWWARCARNVERGINRNKYIEKNLCITLVIYHESLHDALSTKCTFPLCHLYNTVTKILIPKICPLIWSTIKATYSETNTLKFNVLFQKASMNQRLSLYQKCRSAKDSCFLGCYLMSTSDKHKRG